MTTGVGREKSNVAIDRVTIAVFAVVVIVDGIGLSDGRGSAAEILSAALFLVAIAWIAGAAAGISAWVVDHAARLAAHRIRPETRPIWRTLVSSAIIGVPLTAVLTWAARDLLSGPGISRKSWSSSARTFAPLAAFLFVTFAHAAAVGIARALEGSRKRSIPTDVLARFFRRILPITLILGLAVADARIQPLRYAAFHILVWTVIANIVALAVFSRTLRPKRPRPIGIFFAALSAIAVFAVFLDPFSARPQVRVLLLRETQFAKQMVANVLPSPKSRPLTVDGELLDAMRRKDVLDPAELDRLFPNRRKLNVLLLTIDAVRADRFGRASSRRLTPNLDLLADRGAVFTSAWSTYPATSQAFASIMSGLYPSATDVVTALRATGERLTERRQPTLPALMAASGRRTEAVTSFSRAMMKNWFPHIRSGFETFNARADAYGESETPDAAKIIADAIGSLDRADGRPFFLWVHILDPHHPYTPIGPALFGKKPIDLYDAEIHYADREIGRLLDALEVRGLMSETIVCFLSDHGEEFGEKGRYQHASAVSELQIHVPLMFFGPGIERNEITAPVDFTDVAPTILEWVGAEIPSGMHGQSQLKRLIGGATNGEPQGPAAWAFAELNEPEMTVGGRRFAVRDGALKLEFDDENRETFLYDLSVDPNESRDLAPSRPADVARLLTLLDTHRAMIEKTAAGRTRERPTTDALVRSIESGNIESRLYALETLAFAGFPESAEAAVIACARPRLPSQLRVAAVRALGAARGKDSLELLQSLPTSEDGEVAAESIVSLARRGVKVDLSALDRSSNGDGPSRRRKLRAAFALANDVVDEAAALAADETTPRIDRREIIVLLIDRAPEKAVLILADLNTRPTGRALIDDLFLFGKLDRLPKEAVERLRR